MDKLKNSNKIFLVPILFVIVFTLIMLPAFSPIVKVEPNNMPIGLVINDEGEMGQTIENQISENAPDMVSFTSYDSVDEMEDAMDQRDIYGAIELPADFSENIMSLQSAEMTKANVNIYVNEGASAMAASQIETALNNMVSMMNQQISKQIVSGIETKTEEMKSQLQPVLEAQGSDSPLQGLSNMISPISPDMVDAISNPIESEVIKVNEAGSLANIPMAFLTFTWIISIVGAVMLYFSDNGKRFNSLGQKYSFNLVQSIAPFVYALTAGYFATWFSTLIMDIQYESFNTMALYLSLVIAAFMLMIFAVLKWLKLPSIVLFVLLMFFSIAAIQLPPEMLPDFYRDYIYPWVPLRIYADGLKEILFFSKELNNGYSMIFVWIIITSLIVIWLKNFIEKKKTA